MGAALSAIFAFLLAALRWTFAMPPAFELSRTAFVPPPPLMFSPEFGGMLIDSGSGLALPETGLAVNRDTGLLNYFAPIDFEGPAREGVRPIFCRTYRSDLASLKQRSPGLPPGWIDNYDVSVHMTRTDAWSALTVDYPNGAIEMLAPKLGRDGTPTGVFEVGGKPGYRATGKPRATGFSWDSITLEWAACEWTFKPAGDGNYRLALISRPDDAPGAMALRYDQMGRLLAAEDAQHQPLMTLRYEGGRLSSISDGARQTEFRYDDSPSPNAGTPMLVEVLRTDPAWPAPRRHAARYSDNGWLEKVAIPGSTATILYEGGAPLRLINGDGSVIDLR
jgi:hypothetical protein